METAKEILSYLENIPGKAAVTEEIADKFNITLRQVGGYMGALKRKGLVFTYTNCSIVNTGEGVGHHSGSYKMRIENSYYQLT